MKRILLIAAALTACTIATAKEPMTKLTDRVFALAEKQFTALDARLAPDQMPVTYENGKVKDGKLSGWTSGFFPGSLWYVYEYTGNDKIKAMAEAQTEKLSGIVQMKTHHDIGFQVNSSFGNGYRLTGREDYLEVMKASAAKLSRRFSPVCKVIRSWDNPKYVYPVIIDNMMNLELLVNVFNIAGGDSLKYVACTHANTTMKNHFRPDYSCYHLVDYNPENGEVIKRITVQGFSNESTWSRGESWALYGYTMMYRETGDEAYLQLARDVAKYTLSMLPKDGVPEWDFNAPGTKHAFTMDAPGAPNPKKFKYKEGDPVFRDSSAGAVIASALIDLSTFTKGCESKKYKKAAENILRTLASPEYLAEEGTNGNFLLKHGVTSLHTWSGVDIPLTYADYYYLEALLKYKALK